MPQCYTTPMITAFANYTKTREYQIVFDTLIKAGSLPSKAKLMLRIAFDAGWNNNEDFLLKERQQELN